MKAFNPLHTACLLLINETAKEKETEPNTVSKDKGPRGHMPPALPFKFVLPPFSSRDSVVYTADLQIM